ncbi:hypothetical protein Nepgr_032565 [Nepenthes gracilis]|uniref:Thioredoxin-like fold domain-containing protein n=1 Tax=Nepenthes gracilis TaxID=150966 RepID=A0AAD3TL36_NEPGR|nr:hypothetical protein Nepgr_032565 [Nepenthes gracilis]
MQPQDSSILSLLMAYLFLLLLLNQQTGVQAQGLIPDNFDGFVYGKKSGFNPETVMIEAFFDPVCPDTRDSWAPLKQALKFYGPRVSLIVHPFALPYHDNAFVSSRALHIVNDLNSSATYTLLEMFFENQEKFYNINTSNLTRTAIVNYIIDFATQAVGRTYYSAVKSGFSNRQSDLKTRASFKYGCSRGVLGTPQFFVNGFPAPDVGSAIDYDLWRKIIDPLIGF